MSNLPNSEAGRRVLKAALKSLAGRRIGKRLRRDFYLTLLRNIGQYNNDASLETFAQNMNPAHDSELFNAYALAARYGATDRSFTNENFYIDPVNGSDTLGNGKDAAHAFASLSFLLDSLPPYIDNHYRIIILGNINVGNLDIQANFGPNGSLAIIGAAAPAVDSGPYLTTAQVLHFGIDRASVGGAPWGADTEINKWQRFTDGAAQNFAAPVFANISNRAYCTKNFSGVSMWVAGDSFDLISPVITMTTTGINVVAKGNNVTGGVDDSGGKIGFYNLNIDLTGATDRQYSIMAKGRVNFSFVRALIDASTPPMYFEEAEVNVYPIEDTSILTQSLTGLLNLNEIEAGGGGGLCGLNIYDTSLSRNTTQLHTRNSRVTAISLNGYSEFFDQTELWVFASRYWRAIRSFLTAEKSASGNNTGNDSVRVINSNCRLYKCSITNYGGGVNGIVTQDGPCILSLDNIDEGGAAALASSALDVNAITICNTDAISAGFTGIQDILWNTIAVPAPAAWPASKAFVTDGQGSYVAGL